jgi:hypothetical protein
MRPQIHKLPLKLLSWIFCLCCLSSLSLSRILGSPSSFWSFGQTQSSTYFYDCTFIQGQVMERQGRKIMTSPSLQWHFNFWHFFLNLPTTLISQNPQLAAPCIVCKFHRHIQRERERELCSLHLIWNQSQSVLLLTSQSGKSPNISSATLC